MIIDGMSMEMEMFLESFSRWSFLGSCLLDRRSSLLFYIIAFCGEFVTGICGFSGR